MTAAQTMIVDLCCRPEGATGKELAEGCGWPSIAARVTCQELADRFGPIPEPLENLILLQDARIKLGRAGARSVDFAGGRLSVTPIELDSRGAKALRERVPEAIYESGRETVRVRLPDEPAERFRAVVTAAEAILEVATEPPIN